MTYPDWQKTVREAQAKAQAEEAEARAKQVAEEAARQKKLGVQLGLALSHFGILIDPPLENEYCLDGYIFHLWEPRRRGELPYYRSDKDRRITFILSIKRQEPEGWQDSIYRTIEARDIQETDAATWNELRVYFADLLDQLDDQWKRATEQLDWRKAQNEERKAEPTSEGKLLESLRAFVRSAMPERWD